MKKAKATRKAPRKAPRTTSVEQSVVNRAVLSTLHMICSQLCQIVKNTATTPLQPQFGPTGMKPATASVPFDLNRLLLTGDNKCKYRTSDQRVFPARIICTDYWAHKSDTEKQILVIYKGADNTDVLVTLHRDGTEPGTRNQKLYN